MHFTVHLYEKHIKFKNVLKSREPVVVSPHPHYDTRFITESGAYKT